MEESTFWDKFSVNPYTPRDAYHSWKKWELTEKIKNPKAKNPFDPYSQRTSHTLWNRNYRAYHNQQQKETTTMNKDQLYKYGETYVKRLATDSKSQAVVEDASTGAIFAVDPSKLELVVPYTVGVKFYGGNDQIYHYLAIQGSVEKGEILVQAGALLKLATVVEVDTKSLVATVELRNSFPRKLKSEAL